MQKASPEILVIGLGQIGYTDAEYMTQLGLRVDGFDVEPSAVQKALDNKVIQGKATTFQDYDIYLICVSTHNPHKTTEPYLSGIMETAYRLSKEGKPEALVIVESTVTKGTSTKILDLLKHRLHVVHIPHRYYEKEKQTHGVKQLRVMGGCKSCCSRAALTFYRQTLGIPLHVVKKVETAELCKIIENAYRFVEVAFVQELKMFCDSLNVNFEELRSAINSKWNIRLLEARHGIGGHCLPKDTKMYLELLEDVLPFTIVGSAVRSNELYHLSSNLKTQVRVLLPDQIVTAEEH